MTSTHLHRSFIAPDPLDWWRGGLELASRVPVQELIPAERNHRGSRDSESSPEATRTRAAQP